MFSCSLGTHRTLPLFPGKEFNFIPRHDDEVKSGYDKIPYDPCSILHYGAKAFSGNNQATIRLKERYRKLFEHCMGQRKELRESDKLRVRHKYKCWSKLGRLEQCRVGHHQCGVITNEKYRSVTTQYSWDVSTIVRFTLWIYFGKFIIFIIHLYLRHYLMVVGHSYRNSSVVHQHTLSFISQKLLVRWYHRLLKG